MLGGTALLQTRRRAGEWLASALQSLPVRTVLFFAIFFFFWISLEAFDDLSDPAALEPKLGGNILNQVAAVLLFSACVGFALSNGITRLRDLVTPSLVLLMLWIAVSVALSVHPDLSSKRYVLALIVLVQGAVFLVLPSDRRHFTDLLIGGLLTVLVITYVSVLVVPHLAIHQSTDLAEPFLDGNWRGPFAHKNVAGSATVLGMFIGLYVAAERSRWLGWLLVGGSFVFLVMSQSKTALNFMPVALVLSWLVLRITSSLLRVAVVLGIVAGFNLLTVGSAFFEPLRAVIEAISSDPTFTNRDEIWQFSLPHLMKHPWVGFGFQSFWGTEEVVGGASYVDTWAHRATSAHNGYLDTALSAGIPSLVLLLAWIVVAPARDLGISKERGGDPELTKLLTRMWIYALLAGCLESLFFSGGGPLWFTTLLALFGLRFQATAEVAQPEPERPAGGAMPHA